MTRQWLSGKFRIDSAQRNCLLVFAAIVLLSSGCSTPAAVDGAGTAEATADPDVFSFPAEWEAHDAVWVAWVAGTERNSDRTKVMNAMTVDIIRALRARVPLEVVVESAPAAAEVEKRLREEDAWTEDLTFRIHERPYFWMRDPGPLFLTNGAGELRVADFGWNSYGAEAGADELSERAKIIGDYDSYFGNELAIEVVSTDIVSEGGGMSVNGRGTMMATRQTALQRNPGHTLEEIEAEYLRLMGQKKIVWVERSLVEDLYLDGPIAENYVGGGANGHLDEYARFVGPSTILLAEIPKNEIHDNPVNLLNYYALEENYRSLLGQTDQDGNRFEIIRIPMPEVDPMVRESQLQENNRNLEAFEAAGLKPGDTLLRVAAASYLNYLVTNEVVLIAEYWEEGMPESQREKDEQALKIFTELFPDREVIQLRPRGINYYGGGIHCATQQQPVVASHSGG